MIRPSFRFSIGSLIGAVAAFGIACYAIKNPTPFVASVVYSLTMLALGAAAIVAMVRPGKARAFAWGFGVFGGVYLVYAFGIVNKRSEYVDPPRLLTSIALEEIEDATPRGWPRWNSVAPGDMTLLVERPDPNPAIGWVGVGPFVRLLRESPVSARNSKDNFRLRAWSVYPFIGPDPRHNSMSFHQIGHTIATLFLAVGGGIFALWVVPRPRSDG